MSAFDKIKMGLEEAIAFERGELEAKTHKMTIAPISHYDAQEIKDIRKSAGMTQVILPSLWVCLSKPLRRGRLEEISLLALLADFWS